MIIAIDFLLSYILLSRVFVETLEVVWISDKCRALLVRDRCDTPTGALLSRLILAAI